MPKEKTKKAQKSDEIVVNLDAFVVPLSIILAGVIIAGAILLSNKGTGTPTLSGTDNAGDNAAEEEFQDTQTTIADAPYLGDIKKAKVAIVEYTDYQCPYCQQHDENTKADLIKNYVDTGDAIYVFREFPLDFHGQIAIDSANAALCVDEIAGVETFAEYSSKIYMIESKEGLVTTAQDLGVDMGKFNTCVDEMRYQASIDKGLADGAAAGVQGTPGFVVGVLDDDGNVVGKLIPGAYPYDTFAGILDELL
jgi:protein-disulfide isomerase